MKNRKAQDNIEADLNLNIGGKQVTIHVSIESGATGPASVLPFARELSNQSIQVAVEDVIRDGKSISCKAGCGDCCAQLVPVSEIEIREIAKLIKSLPRERKQRVLERFEEAKRKLQAAGLWQQLLSPQTLDMSQKTEFALAYFKQQIFCPFLEEQSCSIHPLRPLACREYLVTSDARYCADPASDRIDGVEIPTRLSAALALLHENDANFHAKWVPLIVAPFWQSFYPALPSKKTGVEWFELFIQKLNA